MRLRAWLAAADALAWLGLGGSRAWLYAMGRASALTEWGHGADCSGGTGEPPW